MSAVSNSTATSTRVEVTKGADAPDAKTEMALNDDPDNANQEITKERLDANQKMVGKYHAMFSKIPTMTSKELVDRWKRIDKMEDERDDSQNIDHDEGATRSEAEAQPGPLLLIDVRSKAERKVSMIQGAVAMDDLETTRWINRYIHNFDCVHKGGTPTIVTYCTIGYRSGREAQWLVDDLTNSYGIEIGKAVEIKNLDGILAYSFVQDAPPLMRPCRKGSSDSFMTRRIHSYGREWAEAVHPSFEVVCFDSKPTKAMHLLQTGLVSAVRMIQHIWSHSKTKTVGSLNDSRHSLGPSKRISATGYTSNESTKDAPLETGSS